MDSLVQILLKKRSELIWVQYEVTWNFAQNANGSFLKLEGDNNILSN